MMDELGELARVELSEELITVTHWCLSERSPAHTRRKKNVSFGKGQGKRHEMAGEVSYSLQIFIILLPSVNFRLDSFVPKLRNS